MTAKELLKKYRNPEYFFNRDLSWVEFNKRVLEEALNPDLPLLEKVKFISIFHTNLDEFYMIRISGLKEQIAANVLEPSIDGLTPREQLQKIEKALKPMLEQVFDLWLNKVTPELRKNHIDICDYSNVSENDQKKLTEYFKKKFTRFSLPLPSIRGDLFPTSRNLSLISCNTCAQAEW